MGHVWTLERPLYDIRTDSYWLVTGDGTTYRFSGPVKPSDELLSLLPHPTPMERRDVMMYMPSMVGLNTYVAQLVTSNVGIHSEDAVLTSSGWVDSLGSQVLHMARENAAAPVPVKKKPA